MKPERPTLSSLRQERDVCDGRLCSIVAEKDRLKAENEQLEKLLQNLNKISNSLTQAKQHYTVIADDKTVSPTLSLSFPQDENSCNSIDFSLMESDDLLYHLDSQVPSREDREAELHTPPLPEDVCPRPVTSPRGSGQRRFTPQCYRTKRFPTYTGASKTNNSKDKRKDHTTKNPETDKNHTFTVDSVGTTQTFSSREDVAETIKSAASTLPELMTGLSIDSERSESHQKSPGASESSARDVDSSAGSDSVRSKHREESLNVSQDREEALKTNAAVETDNCTVNLRLNNATSRAESSPISNLAIHLQMMDIEQCMLWIDHYVNTKYSIRARP